MNVVTMHYPIVSTLRIVQSFETIVDTLISQENFTEVRVIEEDVALVAGQVSNYGSNFASC